MRILSRVRREFGVQIAMRAFFDHPTVEGLSRLIAQKLAPHGDPAAAPARNGV
jgi:hypothetical protein